MTLHLKVARRWLASLVVVLAACGGGREGEREGGSATPTRAPSAPHLVASVSTLALAVSGQARVVILTNQGSGDAALLQASLTPPLPAGTAVTTDCTALPPGGTCRFTFTPGAIPTAAAGATPTPTVLSVAGANTHTVKTTVQVLTYGSVYQSGYVFALDDTTVSSRSVGGKVFALSNASNGVMWSSSGDVGHDGVLGSWDDGVADLVPGIDDAAVSLAGVGCLGRSDGACNSQVIAAFYPHVNAEHYAAGTCTRSKDGYSDWYLPAICELASGGGVACAGSGSVESRLMPVLPSARLPRSGYWSSTTVSANPDGTAWALGMGAGAVAIGKADFVGVRCARALTP